MKLRNILRITSQWKSLLGFISGMEVTGWDFTELIMQYQSHWMISHSNAIVGKLVHSCWGETFIYGIRPVLRKLSGFDDFQENVSTSIEWSLKVESTWNPAEKEFPSTLNEWTHVLLHYRLTRNKVIETRAKVVFVATDKMPYIEEIEEHLKDKNVSSLWIFLLWHTWLINVPLIAGESVPCWSMAPSDWLGHSHSIRPLHRELHFILYFICEACQGHWEQTYFLLGSQLTTCSLLHFYISLVDAKVPVIALRLVNHIILSQLPLNYDNYSQFTIFVTVCWTFLF